MIFSVLLLVFFTFGCTYFYIRDRSPISPAVLLFGIWLIAIIFFSSGILFYYPLNESTFYLILGCFSMFILGDMIIKNNSQIAVNSFKGTVNKTAFKVILIFLFLILCLRFSSIMYSLIGRFGFLGAFTSGTEIYELSRTAQWSPGIPVVIPIETLSILFFSIYRYLFREIKIIYFVVIIFSFGTAFLLQSRFSLMLCIATFLGVYFSFGNKNIPKMAFLFCSAILFALTLGRIIQVADYQLAGSDSLIADMGGLFFYLSSPIGGLNVFMEPQYISNYSGFYSFNGLLRLFSLFGLDSGIPAETDEFYTPVRTISATALRMLFSDFGYFVFFLSLFLGMFYRKLINITASNNTLYRIFCLTCLYQFFLYSFMGLVSFNGGFWLFMIFSIFFILCIKIKKI